MSEQDFKGSIPRGVTKDELGARLELGDLGPELSPDVRRYLLQARRAGAGADTDVLSTGALSEVRKERIWTAVRQQMVFAEDTFVARPTETPRAETRLTETKSGFIHATGYHGEKGSLKASLPTWVASPVFGWALGVAMGVAATLVVTGALEFPRNAEIASHTAETRLASERVEPLKARSAPAGAVLPTPQAAPGSVAASGVTRSDATTSSAITDGPATDGATADGATRGGAVTLTHPAPNAMPRAPEAANLSAEVASLDRVFRLLDEGQPERALELLKSHERSFSQPMLRQEAEAARVIARCRTRSDEPTRRAAAAFSQRLGQSPLRERVERACNGALVPAPDRKPASTP